MTYFCKNDLVSAVSGAAILPSSFNTTGLFKVGFGPACIGITSTNTPSSSPLVAAKALKLICATRPSLSVCNTIFLLISGLKELADVATPVHVFESSSIPTRTSSSADIEGCLMDWTLAWMAFWEGDMAMVAKGVGDAAESGQAWTVTVKTAWGVAAVAMAAKSSAMDETIFILTL